MTARYVGYVLLVAAVSALAAHGLRGRMAPGAAGGVLLGIGLSAAGAVSWIVAAAATIGRGPRFFLAVVALGILARLVVYGAALAYVAMRTTLDPVWTAGSLMGSYAIFIVLEVRFALRGMKPTGSV